MPLPHNTPPYCHCHLLATCQVVFLETNAHMFANASTYACYHGIIDPVGNPRSWGYDLCLEPLCGARLGLMDMVAVHAGRVSITNTRMDVGQISLNHGRDRLANETEAAARTAQLDHMQAVWFATLKRKHWARLGHIKNIMQCPHEAEVAAGSDCWCLDGTRGDHRRPENTCGSAYKPHPNHSAYYRTSDNCEAPFGAAVKEAREASLQGARRARRGVGPLTGGAPLVPLLWG